MLRGYLKYRDLPFDFDRELEVTGNEYTFNVLSAEFPDTLWLNVSYINDTYDALFNANALIHRIVNPKKCDIDYTSKAYGACRIDVGSKIKTNAVNIYFASRIGSAVRYALSIPTRVLENDRGRMTAKFSNDVSSFEVTYECSVPHSLKIHTPYIDMELTKCEDIEDSFRPLKEKDKYGNKPFLTPISLVAVRLSKDFLGFDIERKVEDDIPTWGLYQTIEDVIAANPDKNTSWILDRNYVIVNKDNVDEVLQMFYDYDGLIAFDTETTGLNISFKSLHGEGDVIVGFSLSKDIGHGYYFPLNHVKFDNITDDVTFFMQSKVAPILERKKIICHNTSFDWKVAYLYGINTNVVFDTMCAFACTYRYEFGKGYDTGLKSLAKNILGLDMFDLEDFVMGKWGDDSGINFSHLPYELVRRYAPADTDMTLSLYYWLVNNDVLNRYNATKVHDLEVQFQKVVGYSEYWGYHIDIANLPTLIKGIEDNMAEHEHRMFEIAGHEFNPNSPVQLKSVMYDELGIEKIEGNDSTKAELLKELARITDENGKTKYPFVEELLEYRKSEGTYKNFIKKRDNFITNDGFIFPHVYAFGTDTGRVSIKEPNYQSYDKLVKHYIAPREGYMHFDCDFSQIEYRTLASMAQQTNLCDAMNDPDMDYHTYQASRMFNIPYASVTPALRSQSKGFNFGLPYGMGDRSLGIRIFGKATPENTAKAAELRKKYFQGQEKIQSFFEVVRAQGVANGYTETWLGRRRYYDKKQFNTAKIRRQAGNHVIQGCLDGGTRIQTKELGIVKIKDVAGYSMHVWDGKEWSYGDIMYSGKKQKCIVRFKGGQSIVCSPIHKFLVVDSHGKEHWVECKDLKFGCSSSANNSHVRVNDRYEPSDYRYSSDFACKYSAFAPNGNNVFLENIGGSFDIGVVLGRLASDGSYEVRKDGGSYIKQFVAEHEYNILPELRSCMEALGYVERNKGVREGRNEEITHLTVYSSSLAGEVTELDIKHQVHDNIFMDTEVLRGFLSGYFDGDGGVSGKTISLTFGTQYDFEPMCLDIQKALLFFGIRSRYYRYEDRYKIVIKTNDNGKFLDLIGFLNQDKQDRGRELTCKEKETTFGKCIIVDSVEITDELIDMYDVCNTDNGYYVADGIITHNTAADIYKLGVVSVFDMICRRGWLGKVLINAFVHDEILIEVHKSINPYEFLKCWRQEYEVKIPGFCNLYAGCGFGHNWYEAKTQDLPHQFIQQCIDKADGGIEWDWNTDKFLDELSADYFDYRVKRVADYITDKANDNQVIKPLINTLLGEVTAEKLGVKTKDFNKSYPTLKDKINKFVEVFGITGDIVNIMTAEEAEKSKPTQSNSSQDTSFNVSSMSALEQYISSCLQFGIVVDVENMYVYLRFEQGNPSFMAQVKSMCNPNTGYKLRFVLKDSNSVKLMDTTCYIKYTDIPVLQSAYMAMR